MSAFGDLRTDARAIFDAAVEAVAPGPAVQRALEADPPAGAPFIVSVGKAASAMARAAYDHSNGQGLVVTNLLNARPCRDFTVLVGDHPVPGSGSAAGGAAVERAFAAHDDLMVLVSGGASAMVVAPAPGLTLEDLVRTYGLLTRAGADIGALNTVRRHLSRIKGGQALRDEQRVRALLISDVVGDDPAAIGSGLAAPDPTTYDDALDALARHSLLGAVPLGVRTHLECGASGLMPDTPERGDPRLEGVTVSIVANGPDAVDGARAHAESLGYNTHVLTSTLTGEAREVAQWLADQALVPGPSALIAGGETTVTVRGKGLGGRSQELALAYAAARQGAPSDRPWVLLCAGTDGRDGPTNAAGALIDADIVAALGDVTWSLDNNDSHRALDAVGGLLRTGATGTNVGDVIVLLVGA